MITVETYAKVASGGFVPYDSVDSFDRDIDLVEGAIGIAVDGDLLLGTRYWDYVFPLWAYLSAAVNSFRATGEGVLHFPDQPVRLALTREADGVRLTLRGGGDDATLVASEPQFLQAVRARGVEFFRVAADRYPAERDSIEVSVVSLLGDPPGAILADLHWESRLDAVQVAAIRQVERVTGRRFTPAEREEAIARIAGRGGSFDEIVRRLSAS